MGVITTATLIVLGVTALVGTGGAIWHACTEEDRAKEKIKQLKAENEHLKSAQDYVSGIKTKLSSAKDYLTLARTDFKNGGHVNNDIPLADSEFTLCLEKLENAITNASNLISDFESTITKNNSDIRKEEAKLD